MQLCEQIKGFPRHLGIHNGGMVITGPLITERVPVEPATMPGRYVVQWDKEGLEASGLVKIDILGLRMLSVIAETVRVVGQGHPVLPATFDDPAVYEMIGRADTIGVFQVESRAQSQLQPIFQPHALRRPDCRHLAHPARSDSGQHGASLHPAAVGRRAGDVCPSLPEAGAGGYVGGDSVSGAGAPGDARAGRVHAGPGRTAAAGARLEARAWKRSRRSGRSLCRACWRRG